MSRIKELKENSGNSINLVDIIELFAPEKKSKYTELLLKLMKNTKSLKEHSKEIVENLTSNFDFIAPIDFAGYNEIQILLIYKFLDSFFNVSDLNNFRKFCEYNERGLIEQSDLSRYKTFEDVINQMSVADLKAESKELETQVVSLLETEDYLVVRPLTFLASKKYGANTKWCTTQEGGEYFNKYNKRGVLIYCIGKTNGHKVAAFHSLDKNEPELSWWDAKDSKIDSMSANLPREVRNIVEDTFTDKNVKTNHMTLEPGKRKREEELAKNRYRDLPNNRGRNRIADAVNRESDIAEMPQEIMEQPVAEAVQRG